MTGKPALPGWRFVFLTAALSAVPAPVLAWNAAGHRLIATIAWTHLKPEVRSEVGQLLRIHPDYPRWVKRAGEDTGDRGAFIEASTWPDEIRKDKRFYSAGNEEPTPILPGFPDMERHRNWHYVNIPLGSTADKAPLSGQLDTQLVELTKTLEFSSVNHDRAYALPWLIHLVGDVHQPLHTSIRLDAEGKWDKLGNGLEVQNPFNSRKPVSTLHAFWDDLPGPPWLRGDKLDEASQVLMTVHPRAGRSTSSRRWVEESWQIARDNAYPPSNDPTPIITAAFYESSREIANQRVALAGYRLADLLNRRLLLAPNPKQPPPPSQR